ncbi:hypothetical protein FLONG3_802 [Fusarium longipes]|uniref:Uncharacterized protein n=1 Tax=Fusarium longipes TaxID=694270 RepID=A0A395T8I3_9HYPO|nr:hypothetical protein FLONG3_802 [Fusarium longipes]
MDSLTNSPSWNYATCIPSEVLEYLSRKHPSIQILNFVTDPFCSRFNRWNRTTDMNLSAFNNIRRFSWKAPMGCHFDNIANLVRTNADILEELEVDLQSWSRQWEDREMRVVKKKADPEEWEEWDKIPASTMLAREMFGLDFDSVEQTSFPKMQALRLSRVPLRDETTGKALTTASINMGGLRSLILRMCPHWVLLLQDMVRSTSPIEVKSFEILDFYLKTPPVTAVKKATAIADFLDSFTGLEELFISHCGPIPALKFWDHLKGHASTLKMFVHHQRTTDHDDELLTSRMGRDSSYLTIPRDERDRVREDPTLNPLSRLNLEFIGLTCEPKYLRDILLPFTSKNSLKCLHIRQTAVNAATSPSWVFNKALEIRIIEAEQKGRPINDTTRSDNSLDFQSKQDIAEGLEDILVAMKERREWKTPPLKRSFRHFVDWAFGPTGIASLEYIVAGDLSHRSRYSESNALICRSVGGGMRYRVIKQQNAGEEWRDVKSRFGMALEACPVENTVPEYH